MARRAALRTSTAISYRVTIQVDSWLILALAGVRGPQADHLLQAFGTADGICAASTHDLTGVGISRNSAARIRAPDGSALRHCTAWLEREGHSILRWDDPRYPGLLREVSDAPSLLFVRGDPEALSLPQLAIVGSRNATVSGVDNARRFAAHLARSGFCVTSGLAQGVDAAAHRGALQVDGRTVAVLGNGPDRVYPAQHAQLGRDIAGHGALATEFPPGTPPRREHFPQRNRIISGLALGTLVVEAGIRSGALITARQAGEQGREVFAIPGSIHNPLTKGCHQLIRSGATLVETADDIVAELSGILSSIAATVEQNDAGQARPGRAGLDPQYEELLEVMGWDPISIDTLVTRSGLTTDEVSSMLLILELQGLVAPLAGGLYQQREKGRL
jgi:DNA processing protein